jgi:hypothetical protein
MGRRGGFVLERRGGYKGVDWSRANKYGIIPRSRRIGYILHHYPVKVYQHGKLIDETRREILTQDHCAWLSGAVTKDGRRQFVIRYMRKLYVAKSKDGDLNDPATRHDGMLKSLFIELPDPTICHVCGGTFKPEELKGSQWLICPECNRKDK